jgi:hypothetical protein
MAGQFGLGLGGGPGSIWKIDGSGNATLFTNVTYQGVANSGPGLGNITFDPATKHLFVSDLETGMIHSFDLNRRQLAIFDHGTRGRPRQRLAPVAFDPAQRVGIAQTSFNANDPSTWGYADPARRVFGLAVLGGRLYYSVVEGPQIWSVGVNANGTFADDARLEINITAPGREPITDILFGKDGTMYLSQRGQVTPSYNFAVMAKPRTAVVLAYRKAGNGWEPAPREYAIGFPTDDRNTNGGIALGYGYDQRGNIRDDACERTLWTTGELLRLNPQYADRLKPGGHEIVQGLQGNEIGIVRPDNLPPFKTYFIDFDGQFTDAGFKGHMGDVAILTACGKRIAQQGTPATPATPSRPTAPPGQPDIRVTKTCFGPPSASRAICSVTVVNGGTVAPRTAFQFTDRPQPLVNGAPGAGVVTIVAARPDQSGVNCSALPANSLTCTVPAALLSPNRPVVFDVEMDVSRLAPGWRVRNCVTFNNKNECDETGDELQITKTGPATCIAGTACVFKITITNTGPLTFDGKVAFADNMVISGAPAGRALIEAIRPALGCSPTPAALPFVCQAQLILPPNRSRTFSITVRIPLSAAPPSGRRFQARNCFVVADPQFAPASGASVAWSNWAGGILNTSAQADGVGYACTQVAITTTVVAQGPPNATPTPRPPRPPHSTPTPRRPPHSTPGSRPPHSTPGSRPRPRPHPRPRRPRPIPLPPTGCPGGSYQDGNLCMVFVPEPPADCADGAYQVGGSCVCPEGGDTCVDLPSNDCPDGSYADGGTCMPADEPENPCADGAGTGGDGCTTPDDPDEPGDDTTPDTPDEPVPDDPTPDDQPDQPTPDNPQDDPDEPESGDDTPNETPDEPSGDDTSNDDTSADEPSSDDSSNDDRGNDNGDTGDDSGGSGDDSGGGGDDSGGGGDDSGGDDGGGGGDDGGGGGDGD